MWSSHCLEHRGQLSAFLGPLRRPAELDDRKPGALLPSRPNRQRHGLCPACAGCQEPPLGESRTGLTSYCESLPVVECLLLSPGQPSPPAPTAVRGTRGSLLTPPRLRQRRKNQRGSFATKASTRSANACLLRWALQHTRKQHSCQEHRLER